MSSQAEQPQIRLAILDDYANTAPTHFRHIRSLAAIDSFPDTLHPSKPADLDALVQRLHPYHVISTTRERTAFPAALIARLPNLKLLLSSGRRNAALDMPACRERGIPVTGTKGEHAYADSGEAVPPKGYSGTNQHAWALLLSLCGRVPRDDRALKTVAKAWQSGLGVSLGGKTLGVVGLGNLGGLMAKTAALAFGMEVVAWSENLTQEKADAAAVEAGFAKGAWKVVGKEELFRSADVVSLHLVLSERTRDIVAERELRWMKDRALLVNTSRGGLIDESALVQTVKEGRIGGVALDVYWEEPVPESSLWRKVDEWAKSEVVMSPHMGYVNSWTINSWYIEQAENLERWLNGEELLNRID